MTFIAAGLSVEELPAALGRVVNGVLVAGDESIKRRIKRQLCAFVGRNGSQEVGTIGRPAKYALECLLVFLDGRDLRHSRIQVWVTHLKGIENGRRVALADAAFDADGHGLPVGEGQLWIMACAARDSAVNRQAAFEKKFLAQGNFLRGLRIVRRDRSTSHFNGHANLLKRL